MDEPVAPAFQRQRVAVILPALALAADDIVRRVIDRLTVGGVGLAAGGHYEVGSVRLAVQHDIFFFRGSKRVVTIRIRAGQIAVMLVAVDVVELVKATVHCKAYNKRGSSGKIVGFITRKDIRGVWKSDIKHIVVHFGQFVVASNAFRQFCAAKQTVRHGAATIYNVIIAEQRVFDGAIIGHRTKMTTGDGGTVFHNYLAVNEL